MRRTCKFSLKQGIRVSLAILLTVSPTFGNGKPEKPTPSQETPVVVTFSDSPAYDVSSDGGPYLDGASGVRAVFTEFDHLQLSVGDRALYLNFDNQVTPTEASPDWSGDIPFSGNLSFRVKDVASVPESTGGLDNAEFESFCDDLFVEAGNQLCGELDCSLDPTDPACLSSEDGGSLDGAGFVRRMGLALNLKPDGERDSYAFWYQNPNSDFDSPDVSSYVRVFHVKDQTGDDVWVLSPERVSYSSGQDEGPLGTLIRLSRKSVQAGQYLIDFRASVRLVQ